NPHETYAALLDELGVDLFPKMDYPNVRIEASFSGANPEEMELEVARPIEEAVNSIGGIDSISSSCSFGKANVMVKFDLEKDIDIAAQEVRDKVARITRDLPQEMDPPTVQKMDPDSKPVITFIVSSGMSMRDLTFFTRKRLIEPLEAIDGVGSIQLVGERNREIQVVLDAKKMCAVNTSVTQVKQALKAQNMEVPGGNVTSGDREFVLRNMGRIKDPRKFGEILVSPPGALPVRISDIGEVVDGEAEPRSLARLDGKTCLSITVQKQSGVNTLDVVNSVKERVEQLKENFPAGMEIVSIRDQSTFIEASLHELNMHLIMGSLFASLSVLLFMRNIVSTVIASLAIPVSIIASFLFMKIMGFSLNNMTMLGLTLAIGIVIDDAIVVLENIFRHMEELGSDSMKAAEEATSEIYLAVMATTLSLAVIFIPVAFVYGIIGSLLNNFGLTMAFSIMISLFVSFTLTPMLCSRLFRYSWARNADGHSKESWFYGMVDRTYGSLLRFSLARRWVILLVAGLCVFAVYPMSKFIRADFLPADDTGEYTVSFRTGEGYSINGTDKVLREVEEKLKRLSGVVHMYSTIGEGGDSGVNQGSVFIQLEDLAKRTFSQFDSVDDSRKIMKSYKDFQPSVQNAGVQIMGGGRSDLQFYIKGPDLDQINSYANILVNRLRESPIIGNANSSFIERKPEIHVEVDRDRSFRAGVPVDSVYAAIRTLVGGEDQIGYYQEGDEMYDVKMRLRPEDRADLAAVSSLFLQSTNGTMVRLDAIASLSYGFGPAKINRQDRQRSISISATLAKNRGLGEANALIRQAIRELHLPPEYTFGFSGKSLEMERTTRGFIVAFMLSAVFMYMILASQFESFLHPLTIMLSLPLSIPFALLSLLVTNNSLNVYSALGVFMLFGIVKKNAILQIDYTNTLRSRGIACRKAVLEANRARLRPILMTTMTLVAGMLPMALGSGPGAATRSSMALVIIGGQSLCLLITLLLTPVAYTLFDDLLADIKRRFPGIYAQTPVSAATPMQAEKEK
ncbi:MAG TPA: efflux RND transporter permease subunit, partial [Candidatus Ozemobacteraceae bacterium]|nr:efflux RND transporter permease subunit [Candidatus Ozemobacteraceae bacterium]